MKGEIFKHRRDGMIECGTNAAYSDRLHRSLSNTLTLEAPSGRHPLALVVIPGRLIPGVLLFYFPPPIATPHQATAMVAENFCAVG